MPKEQLNITRHADDLSEGMWQEIKFGIKWFASNEDVASDGYAQFYVTMDRKQLKALLESDEPLMHMDPDNVTIYSDTLSRHELNRSVKIQRKARDQVHGADE